jgi:hypothetical protein
VIFRAHHQQETTVTSKNDCFDYFTRSLIRTSEWRRTQAARFPNDFRNDRAAKALWQLASADAGIDDEQWRLLSPFFNPKDDRFHEIVSRCSRDVGFRSNPESFADYIETIVEAVAVSA